MRAVVLFVSFKILGYSILTGYSAQRNFVWHKWVYPHLALSQH